MNEYSFEFEIPSEIITKVSIDTGILLDPTLKLNITYSKETLKYSISEINNKIVTNNSELRLLDGDVFRNSLDIYFNEKI